MPPRKVALEYQAKLQKLMRDHSIEIRGHVRPKKWPSLYSHHFKKIRDIWSARYDDYMNDPGIGNEKKRKQRRRVNALVEKAYEMREDLGVNESTWRFQVESIVTAIFDEHAICSSCGNERQEPDFVALPHDLDTDTMEALKLKRKSRRRCDCKEKRQPFIDLDDEKPKIFKYVADTEVMHAKPDEWIKTKKHRVPMKPDRLIGLYNTPRMRDYQERSQFTLDHSVVKGTDLLYPFLVIEAKKGDNAPGFRKIERQTSFPIRRFLLIQEDLRIKSKRLRCEPPLVWFFAYQGEEWRLYAAVLEKFTMSALQSDECKTEVGVYDLWHGTIESEDGALQILQVVDYIWSWARDIFRPHIKACLVSEVRRRESTLVSRSRLNSTGEGCYVSHRTETPDTIMTDILETTENVKLMSSSSDMPEGAPFGDQELDSACHEPPIHRSTTGHPFSQWKLAQDTREEFSNFATVQPADIVIDSFRISHIQNMEQFFQRQSLLRPSGSQFKLLDILGNAFSICSQDIQLLGSHWTSETLDIKIASNTVTISVFFHMYCRMKDWQIVRQLECVIWPDDLEKHVSHCLDSTLVEKVQQQELIRPELLLSSLQELMPLTGKVALFSALHETYRILSFTNDAIDWTSVEIRPSTMRTCIDLLNDDRLFPDRTVHLERMTILGEYATTTQQLLYSRGQVPDWHDAKVIVRPNEYTSGPKFCLFIFSYNKCGSHEAIVELLRNELLHRRFYGNNDCSKSDTRRLKEWLMWLEKLQI